MGVIDHRRRAVLHVNTSSPYSTSPTMRIARYVSDYLGIPLIHDQESADRVMQEGPVETIFVKHGLLRFSDHRQVALDVYRDAKTVINLMNDATFHRDSRFAKLRETEIIWGTVPREFKTKQCSYVNWNVLTWNHPRQWREPKPFCDAREPELLYYGAFKEIRDSSFRRYFTDPALPIVVASYRGTHKFARYGSHILQLGGKLQKSIQAFRMTVYLEDDYSHETYTSPGNRFYECLQEGVAQVFDEHTVTCMRTAGFDVTPYVVSSSKDVIKMMPHWDEIRRKQREEWYHDYTIDLNQRIDDANMKLVRLTV